MRIFSVRRAALSCVLGFLIPLSYAFRLSEAADYTRRPTPEFLVWPFGWPRPIWILLMGREPRQGDIVGGIIFLTACNILVYGTLVYVALTMFSVLRRRRVDYAAPPPPEKERPAAE